LRIIFFLKGKSDIRFIIVVKDALIKNPSLDTHCQASILGKQNKKLSSQKAQKQVSNNNDNDSKVFK